MLTLRAYAVHLLTASGIVFAFLAAAEICRPVPDPRWVFLWLIIAGVVDAADGPLARRWDTKRRAPRFDGRRMDDIIDYLTFTFVPLLLVWRMGWLPAPAGLWIAPAMLVSVLGFANVAAKNEEEGFFAGFPSYWNLAAYYAGLQFTYYGPWPPAWTLALFAALTLAPVRFVYPNLAPAPWRRPIIVGAILWIAMLAAMLPFYPQLPRWLMWLSLLFPAAYTLISIYLDVRARWRRPDKREGHS